MNTLSPFAKNRERELGDESEVVFASEGFCSRRSAGKRYHGRKPVGALSSRSLIKISIFLVILIFAAAIRFYRLPEMASFDYDQESASAIVYSILNENHIRLLGQELSFQGMFMGPFYYYFLAPFYFLSHFHPIGGLVASILLGLIIITSYYFLGSLLFGEWGGIIAAFLRSILHEELLHDWSMIPSYACELFVLATWFCFYKLWKRQNPGLYLPILAFIFGLYTSMYPILFPFYLVFLYLLLRKKISINRKSLFISILFGLIPISTLLVFEFRYGFIQTRRVLEIISQPKEPFSLKHLSYFFQYNLFEIDRILNLQFIPKIISLSTFFVITFVIIKKKIGFWKEDFHKELLLVTYPIFILSFTFLPTHVSDNYFLALSTLSLLYISGMLSLLSKRANLRIVLGLLLLNIFIFNFTALRERWNNPSLANLYHKEKIVQEIVKLQPDNTPFYVSYITLPGWNYGFDYLFKYWGKEPLRGVARGPIYTIVTPRYLVMDSLDVSYGNVGLILPEEITKGKHPFKSK